MLQLTPQMRILVAVEPVDGRKGIDSLLQICRQKLGEDPFSGCVFVFRNRNAATLRVLVYDGQGFWLAQKRLSQGRFKHWPGGAVTQPVEAHQAQVLFAAGDPAVRAAPIWKAVRPTRSAPSEQKCG